jgi:predicted nucleic acid-binding Zn ribbon protein
MRDEESDVFRICSERGRGIVSKERSSRRHLRRLVRYVSRK